MILTCPQCATRYKTDAAKFPAEGRNVRCAKCGNVWHQMPEPDEPDATVLPPQPETEQPVVEETVRSEPVPVIREPVRPAFVPDAVEEDAVSEPSVFAPPRRSRFGMIAGWLLLAIAVGALVASAVLFRQDIVSLWPQTATLYSAVGLDVNARGIALEDVSYVKGREIDQVVLIVSGKLRNISHHELPVPQLRVGLSDSSKREIYHWTFSPDTATLTPGQMAIFRTRLTSPPPAAVGIEVRFVKDDE